MFRPRGTPLLLNLAALGLLLSGCHSTHVLYRDMYSPRKNHFERVPEKAPVMPPEKKKGTAGPEGGGTVPAIPVPPPAATGIPGLEATPPAAPAPALPMAQ